MGKIGLKPCGRHHRWWCRGKRRCCPRSLWCLWFPCTSPEKKRLLPHLLKILKPVLQRRKWRRQGGEASWWPPGSVSQTGAFGSILYSFLLGLADTHHMRKTAKSGYHGYHSSCRSRPGSSVQDLWNRRQRTYESHSLLISIWGEEGGDPSFGLFQQIWLGCHPSDSEALITIRFLATLVALHFTPVSKSVSRSFGLA